jgi:YihY family inner membrane protein
MRSRIGYRTSSYQWGERSVVGLRKQWKSWQDFRSRLWTRQWRELTGRDRRIRFILEIGRLAVLRLRRNRAGMMAAALSYRVLFSLLPLLVLAGAVARLSVSKERFLETVHNLLDRLGLQRVVIPSGEKAGEKIDLGNWLEGLAEQASNYDVTGITWIGIVVLIWAVYRLFAEIEASLSVIGSGTKRRSTWARVVVSVLLLVVGPALATWGLAVLTDMTDQLEATGISVLAQVGGIALSLLAVWLFVMLAYRFIPAGELRWKPAAVGAAVAAVALYLGEWALESFAVGAVRTSPIGGSLGLVPLLMLWVYVMWLCLLYGMEIAVILQRARKRWRTGASLPSPATDQL